MAKLTVIRPDKIYNRFTDYSIFIDEKHVLDLNNNSKKTINVEPKEILVKAKTHRGWRGSKAHVLDLSEAGEIKLKVSANTILNHLFKFCQLLFITFFLLSLFFDNNKLIHFAVTIFALAAIVLLIFSFTSQKDAWLKISLCKEKVT